MAGKAKSIISLLVIYLVMFWIGFRSGEIYNRAKAGEIYNLIRAEEIYKRAKAKEMEANLKNTYFIIEKQKAGNYESVNFYEAEESHPIIKIFRNEKLKDLLKQGNIQIYTSDGKRIY